MISGNRQNEIKQAVITVLKKSGIDQLPVDINKIFNVYGWRLLTFDEARENGINTVKEKDGLVLFQAGRYLVLYDDKKSPGYIRWILGHEIGHIVLKHAEKDSRHAHEEANYFAEQFLAPTAVVARLGVESADDISRMCNITKEVAERRWKDIQKYLHQCEKHGYTKHDKEFLRIFDIDYKR